MCPEDAGCGLLGEHHKQERTTPLDEFIGRGLFQVDPERVSACLDGGLSLPLLDESRAPVAEKLRRSSSEEE